MTCELCGETITELEEPNVYVWKAGWAKPRDAGGTNALALPIVFPERRAHVACVRRVSAGISTAQGTLA